MQRILLATLFTLISALLIAQDVDPVAILRRASLFGQFSSIEVDFTMEIHERRGTKDRRVIAYVERDGDDTKTLIQIVSPPFLNNIKFLSMTAGDTTTRWLATSRGIRNVPASSRNDQIFDSDFTVEDLSDYNPDEFNLTSAGIQRINGSDSFVLVAIPLDIEADYAKRIIYVDTQSGLMVLARFLDDSGVVIREFELLEIMDLDGVAFPSVAKMTTLSSNTFTILTINDAQAGHDIPDTIFNRGDL